MRMNLSCHKRLTCIPQKLPEHFDLSRESKYLAAFRLAQRLRPFIASQFGYRTGKGHDA